jgi:hypothetical protein
VDSPRHLIEVYCSFPGNCDGSKIGHGHKEEEWKPAKKKPCYSGNSITDKTVRFFSLLRIPETWKEWVAGGGAKILFFGAAKAGATSAGGAESLGAAAIGTAGKGVGLAGTGAMIVATMADFDCQIGPVEPYTEK